MIFTTGNHNCGVFSIAGNRTMTGIWLQDSVVLTVPRLAVPPCCQCTQLGMLPQLSTSGTGPQGYSGEQGNLSWLNMV